MNRTKLSMKGKQAIFLKKHKKSSKFQSKTFGKTAKFSSMVKKSMKFPEALKNASLKKITKSLNPKKQRFVKF